MNIELVDLRLFVYIAECENLTRWGRERLFFLLRRPSARIKSLEHEAGATVVSSKQQRCYTHRRGRSVPASSKIGSTRQVDFLHAEMINPDSGHIRISANTTALTEFLPEILAQFLTDWPGVTVDLQERLTRDIIRSVSDGTSDLGIISGDPKTDNLQVIPLLDRQIGCWRPPPITHCPSQKT